MLPASTPPRTAIIVGGGIAGLAAAIRLTEAGVRVTLLETRKKLGGRATSFADVRSGQVLDNCQHVVLGCCTNYLDLLARLGVRDSIQWSDEQYWVEEGGRTSVIRPGVLPAPLHFSVATMRAGFLSTAEVLALARIGPRLMRVKRENHQNETFAAFLARSGQPQRVIARFWSPIVVSACNLDVDRVAASVALHVFQEGFLGSADAASIGLPTVPLVELYRNAEQVMSRSGGRILLGAGVERLDDRGATTTDGQRHEADRVICAVPVERVNRIVDESIRRIDPRFAPLDSFTHSPILGVHLRFDRPVLSTPHAVLVDRPTQWLFRKDAQGAYLHAVISAADAWMELSEQQIADRVVADIHACFPGSRGATLEMARAVKEKLATFAPLPGVERLRPDATHPASRVILAGDYTNTGWPATMEGAAKSGYAAAAAALEVRAEQIVVRPMKAGRLARVLGLRVGA